MLLIAMIGYDKLACKGNINSMSWWETYLGVIFKYFFDLIYPKIRFKFVKVFFVQILTIIN